MNWTQTPHQYCFRETIHCDGYLLKVELECLFVCAKAQKNHRGISMTPSGIVSIHHGGITKVWQIWSRLFSFLHIISNSIVWVFFYLIKVEIHLYRNHSFYSISYNFSSIMYLKYSFYSSQSTSQSTATRWRRWSDIFQSLALPSHQFCQEAESSVCGV